MHDYNRHCNNIQKELEYMNTLSTMLNNVPELDVLKYNL